MKLKCFARPPKFRNRMIMMLLGVITQGFGLSLLIQLNLGTDSFTCFTLGVDGLLPFSFGTSQLLCNLVSFLFVIRFDLSKIGFGTIGNMVFLGYIADFFGWIWGKVLPADFFAHTAVRYGLLIPVLIVFIGGASAYMSADLGASPYDALPFIISDHVKKLSFKTVRMIWDCSFLVVGFLLGGPVGVVTFIVAFFLGPAITWVRKKLEVFLV